MTRSVVHHRTKVLHFMSQAHLVPSTVRPQVNNEKTQKASAFMLCEAGPTVFISFLTISYVYTMCDDRLHCVTLSFPLPLLLSPFLSTTCPSLWCVCVGAAYAGSHCCCMFTIPVTMSCEDVFHSAPLLPLTLAVFPFLLPWRSLDLGEGDVEICFRVGVLNSPLPSTLWLLMNVCINCCPQQKEVSLAQADSSTDLQVQTQIFRGSLPTGPFSRISVVNPAPGPVTSFAVGFDYVLILETCGNLAAYFDLPTEHD